MSDDPTVELTRWDGPWSPDDPDANLKSDVALYTKLDPLTTLTTLSANTGIPVGALVRYVLARWASAGSEALLAAGPSVVEHMGQTIEAAEAADTDESRLQAYDVLRQMVSWLRVPLEEPAARSPE
jgi:hypothetical protein